MTLLKSSHGTLIMPGDHYSKWKLNKSEQKKVDDDEKDLIKQLIGAGKTKQEAEDQASKAKDLQTKALWAELELFYLMFVFFGYNVI